jgi:hypothetical protein
MRFATIAVTTGLLIGALAGCSSAPTAPQRLSPAIPGDPIDLTEFVKAPCGLMTAQQLVRFYITAPGVVNPPVCTWTPSDTAALHYQASVDTTSGGLEELYRRRASVPGFDPTTVHSYPGVHRDVATGRCTVDVGVANDTLLAVTVIATDAKLDAYQDPCGEADRFAGTLVGYQGHRAP